MRNLERMCETGPEHVAFVVYKYLGLVFEATKGRAVNDAVPVALELRPKRRRGFWVPAPARLCLGCRIRGHYLLW